MSDRSDAISKPDSAMTNKGSGERLATEAYTGLDVVNHFRINDPGKVTMPEVYGMPNHTKPEDVHNMLNGFDIVGADDFMKGVHSLKNRADAQKVPLNKEFLEKVAKDPMIGNQERGAAFVMSGNIRDFATDPEENGFSEIARNWRSESKFTMTPGRIEQMDETASEIVNSRNHPEMRDSKQLAETAETLLGNENGNYLSEARLRNIARSPSFSPQQRAAASMLRINYPVFASLSETGSKSILDRDDINVLSKLRNSEEEGAKAEQTSDCNRQNTAGQALAWGVAVTAVSIALGSENPMRNGSVAAGSAAVSSEVKTSICKNK